MQKKDVVRFILCLDRSGRHEVLSNIVDHLDETERLWLMELMKRLNGTRGLKRKRVKTIAARRKHFWKAIRGFPIGAEVEVCASDDRDFRRGERLVIQEFSARSIILRKQDGDRWNFGPAALESLQLRPLGSPFGFRFGAPNGEVKL